MTSLCELWQPCDIDLYEVSSMGNIRNSKRKTLLRKQLTGNGYERVTLRDGDKYVGRDVHRLVAQAFIPNPHNKKTVNHKNKVRNDNRAENLEWATNSEQTLHARNTDNIIEYNRITLDYQEHNDEIWKDIPNAKYEVSNYGYIRNKQNGYIKTLTVDGRGYVYVNIHSKSRSVHRLVAEVYLSDFTSDCIINHKDGNKTNNHVTNLECTTQRMNVFHSYANNLMPNKKKSKVIQVDVQGQIIASFESLAEAEATTGINRGCIHHALHNKSVSKGFKWYSSYEEYLEDSDNIKNDILQVYQCTMDGNIIASFPSFVHAANATGISKSNINRAVNRNKEELGTAGGYIWYSNRIPNASNLIQKLKEQNA